MTFFSVFNIPVFWPILLIYFLVNYPPPLSSWMFFFIFVSDINQLLMFDQNFSSVQILFGVTMKRQIKHMIKYRYIPCSFGKKSYKGGKKGGNKIQEDIRSK